jgi:stage IV sporulation protein FB
MHFRNGCLVIKLSGAIPVLLIHWTVLVLAVIISGFSFQPGVWLAVIVIILVHELGHAYAVLKARATVVAIRMNAMGGCCEWAGRATRTGRLAIAWGGVLAQLLLWGITYIVSFSLGPATSEFSAQFFHILLGWNLILVAFNLIPLKPLDGYDAWRLLSMTLQDWRQQRRRMRRQRLTAKTIKKMEELERLEAKRTPNPEVTEMINQIIQRAATEHKSKNQASENKED